MTIFNVSQRPDGSWNVEGPKTEILFAGFSVLDVLKDQARELLLAYYVGCEDIYQKGVKEWADDTDTPGASRPPPGLAAAPGASRPAAGLAPAPGASRPAPGASNPLGFAPPPESRPIMGGGRRLI
jgi:hypothetical protein